MAGTGAGIPALLVAPNLDSPLHLETENAPGRIDDEKIELGLDRPTTLAWQNEASGMEDGPVAREVAFECGEDLALGIRGIGVRTRWKHPGHPCFIPRDDIFVTRNRSAQNSISKIRYASCRGAESLMCPEDGVYLSLKGRTRECHDK